MRGKRAKQVRSIARMLMPIPMQRVVVEKEYQGGYILSKSKVVDTFLNHERQLKRAYRRLGTLGMYVYAGSIIQEQETRLQQKNNEQQQSGSQDTENQVQGQDELLQVQDLAG